MTAKERVLMIRLSEKINKNPEYAKLLGISIINVKTKSISHSANQALQVKGNAR